MSTSRPAAAGAERSADERQRALERVTQGRAEVQFDAQAISPAQAEGFAALAARGIEEVERLLELSPGRKAVLRFVVRDGPHISAARGRSILLPAHRVRACSAPYLHEIAHVLLPCRHAPAWFSEGLACYVECAVAERGGGYDSRLFTENGNGGVDQDAVRWLADSRGRAVLPYVGRRGVPPRIAEDRHGVAAPFYVLSHSLVKFLADHAGISPLTRMARARSFATSVRKETGRSMQRWRSEWLRTMLRPMRVGMCHPGPLTNP